MPGGRPLKYDNCWELDLECELYFEHCHEEKEPPTVSGLALWLDVDRKTITNYEGKPEFFPTIKRSKQRIENYLEMSLYGNGVAGVIFNLKNNFGWKDKQEIQHSVDKDTLSHAEKLAAARRRKVKDD